ncbi:MAG: hypothetical protein KME42_02290 [Tildeniella nuda ZEHNDER 1965/U140]|nr:hypothetical protein [Tildeniella nuda ZEHNDER 1965/U140]
MSNLAPLTETEVREFAEAWYRKLDVHEPLENYRPLLAEEVELVFPEATVKGFEGYAGWYDRVINIFFDEVHTVKETTLTSVSDEKATVKVVVKWEASVWKPPAPNSERIVLDAYQTWVVVRSPATGKPAILTYIVDSLDYAPGSATL